MSEPDAGDDASTFIRFEGLKGADGEDQVLSRGAFMMHSFGIVNSFEWSEHGGFVPDEYLDSITADSTTEVVELEASGLWQRVDGGYEIHDEETLGFVRRINERKRQGDDEP